MLAVDGEHSEVTFFLSSGFSIGGGCGYLVIDAGTFFFFFRFGGWVGWRWVGGRSAVHCCAVYMQCEMEGCLLSS